MKNNNSNTDQYLFAKLLGFFFFAPRLQHDAFPLPAPIAVEVPRLGLYQEGQRRLIRQFGHDHIRIDFCNNR